MMYKSVIRPLLMWFSPMMARRFFLTGLKAVNRILILRRFVKCSYSRPSLQRSCFGLDFVNPVGIASGVDWKAKFIDPLSDIGASFVTVGPLTVKGGTYSGCVRNVINDIRTSPYNPGKLIFADLHADPLVSDREKVNEMDRMYTLIYDFTDAAIINLQDIPFSICSEVIDRLTTIRSFNDEYKPILLHMNDEYSEDELSGACLDILKFGLDGIVISGGNDAVAKLRHVLDETNRLLPVIVSDGVKSHEQAKEMIDNGASLIAIKDILFKEGPAVLKRTLKYLAPNE